MNIDMYRQFFAEEIAAVAGLASPTLVTALQTIPREGFLPPGPWLVRGEGDAIPRPTTDADARHVYHNYSIAIDAARHLYNGAPGVVGRVIDALQPRRGERVLHVGAGLGYYSAVLAHMVGDTGRVVAVEADADLAAAAGRHLAAMPWVEVRDGDATTLNDESFDVILVSAGLTHVPAQWLAALSPSGRIAAALTATMPAMGPLGKGFTLLLTRTSSDDALDVRVLGMTAIYSAVAVRDEAIGQALGQAMMRSPFPRIAHCRCDPHPATAACWLHTDGFCLTSE